MKPVLVRLKIQVKGLTSQKTLSQLGSFIRTYKNLCLPSCWHVIFSFSTHSNKNPMKKYLKLLIISSVLTSAAIVSGQNGYLASRNLAESGLEQDTSRKAPVTKKDSISRKKAESGRQPSRNRMDTSVQSPSPKDTASNRIIRKESDSDPVMRGGHTAPANPGDSIK